MFMKVHEKFLERAWWVHEKVHEAAPFQIDLDFEALSLSKTLKLRKTLTRELTVNFRDPSIKNRSYLHQNVNQT